jgi:hypothetical protein
MGVTSPRAVGVRLPYADVPSAVRAWVDDALVSPVATWTDIGLPTLNEFRRTEARRFLAAAARRLS